MNIIEMNLDSVLKKEETIRNCHEALHEICKTINQDTIESSLLLMSLKEIVYELWSCKMNDDEFLQLKEKISKVKNHTPHISNAVKSIMQKVELNNNNMTEEDVKKFDGILANLKEHKRI